MNADKSRANGRKWYAANKEKRDADNRARQLRRYHANLEKSRAYAREIYWANRDKKREQKLIADHGITAETFSALFAEQDGRCKVCQRHQSELKRVLNVDHDHETGYIRGLLCIECNTALGLAKDSPQRLRDLAKYLEDCGLKYAEKYIK